MAGGFFLVEKGAHPKGAQVRAKRGNFYFLRRETAPATFWVAGAVGSFSVFAPTTEIISAIRIADECSVLTVEIWNVQVILVKEWVATGGHFTVTHSVAVRNKWS